jgi:GT2 family glycosyltransferase
MRIASVTVTMNDFHSIDQWKNFYEQYASAIYMHIIVDNNSRVEYKNRLRESFPQSVIIERDINGGITAGFNDGIKHALNDPAVDSIMLLGNDIDIDSNSIYNIYSFLYSEKKIGAVAPILMEPDKKTIQTHGEKLRLDMSLERLYHGKSISDSIPELVESQCLPGAMNLVKREVYEKVGILDESLFMYMDENEFFYRVTNYGYKLYSLKSATSAHCHIPTEGKMNDNSLAWFYTNRNNLIVCKRYRPLSVTSKLFIKKFFWQGVKMSYSFVREHSLKKVYYYYLGLIVGMLGCNRNFVQKR